MAEILVEIMLSMPDLMTSVRPPSRSRENRIRSAIRKYAAGIRAWHSKPYGMVDGSPVMLAVFAEFRNPPGHDPFLYEALDSNRDPVDFVVRSLALADPTDCGTYVDWLVQTWLKELWRLEDVMRLRDDLTLFDRNRHRLPVDGGRDIGRYPTPQALLQVVRAFRTKATADVARDRPEMMCEPQARMLRDDAEFQVVMPLTAEAAAFWGDGSEWCICWGVPGSRYPQRKSRFADYAAQGSLLIVRRRADNSLWALHVKQSEFMPVRLRLDLWDQDDTRVGDALKALIAPDWASLFDEAVVAVVEEVVPHLRALLEMDAERQRRILHVCGTERTTPDEDRVIWRGASAEDRHLGISLYPLLVLGLDNPTSEERQQAIRLRPTLALDLNGITPQDRLLAIHLQPGIVKHSRFCPTPGERLAALEADPLLLFSLGPLDQAEEAVVLRLRPDLAECLRVDHVTIAAAAKVLAGQSNTLIESLFSGVPPRWAPDRAA